MLLKDLTGKTILITGGTSRLGQCFVRQALEHGSRVFFTYHQSSPDSALVQAGATACPLDLSRTQSIDELAQSLRSQIESLDVLIHNAAAVRDHTLVNMSEDDWDYVMNVNVKAPFYLTKKLLPLFLKGRKKAAADPKAVKKIFMITSRAAIQGGFGISNYAASKAALISLSKSLAQELGSRRILVNAVNPGFMQSRMTENLPKDCIDANVQASQLERFSDPEEVAAFLIYLCSDRMTQVTGQVFHFESRKIA